MNKAILYIHGKGGNYMEAEQYRENCKGFDIIGVDYEVDYPWAVEDKILAAYTDITKKYDLVYVLANSIGAYFAMHILQKNCKIEKALFISPILDMEIAKSQRYRLLLVKHCLGNICVSSENIRLLGTFQPKFYMRAKIL